MEHLMPPEERLAALQAGLAETMARLAQATGATARETLETELRLIRNEIAALESGRCHHLADRDKSW